MANRPNQIDPRIGYRDLVTHKMNWPLQYQSGLQFIKRNDSAPMSAWVNDEFFYVIQMGRKDDLAIRAELFAIVETYELGKETAVKKEIKKPESDKSE